jgi:hypothetical protein
MSCGEAGGGAVGLSWENVTPAVSRKTQNISAVRMVILRAASHLLLQRITILSLLDALRRLQSFSVRNGTKSHRRSFRLAANALELMIVPAVGV